jgi:integrase
MATNPIVFPGGKLPEPKEEKAKRRGARGRGSVFQPTYTVPLPNGERELRKTKLWWIRFTDPITKKRISQKTNFTKKAGAEKLLTDLMNKSDRGELADFMEYREVTFGGITAALRTHYAESLRRSTDKLEMALKRLEGFFGTERRVVTIDAELISKYRAFRMGQPNTQFPTVNRELAALKTAFRLAVAQGKARKMPQIKLSDESERKDEGEFSKEQLAAFQANARPYLKPLLLWLSLTGMRVMEPIGMTWAEVNLEHAELRLSGRKTKNKAQKVLHISDDLMKILKAQRALQTRCDSVFVDSEGEPLRYDACLDHFQQLCRKLGITEGFLDANGKKREPGFHDFRRTFARMADRAGVPHRIIMEIAGWKSVAMLLRYLGTSKASEQRAGFDALAASIR